jgi:hypothetical protein
MLQGGGFVASTCLRPTPKAHVVDTSVLKMVHKKNYKMHDE